MNIPAYQRLQGMQIAKMGHAYYGMICNVSYVYYYVALMYLQVAVFVL